MFTYLRRRCTFTSGKSAHSAAFSASKTADGIIRLLSELVGDKYSSAFSRYGGAVAAASQPLLTVSAIVSVVDQQYWVDSTYPIVREGYPMIGSASPLGGGDEHQLWHVFRLNP